MTAESKGSFGSLFIIRTGLFKILIAGLLVQFSGLWMMNLVESTKNEWIGVAMILTAPILMFGGFCGMCLLVRCPTCRSRLLWKAVSQEAAPGGLHRLFTATKCPVCGA